MADPRFKTGARLSPRHKLLAATPHGTIPTAPTQWPTVLPTFLEMWLNDQDGDCVTAESAAAKALYSAVNGQPELKITDATVLAFCNKYGVLNGADLASVCDEMAADGFHQDNTQYKEGPKQGVDYSNEVVLQSAIFMGPVKIAIGSGDLPNGAGNQNGWYALGAREAPNDHCVGLWGFGPAEYLWSLLAKAYGVGTMPSALAGLKLYLCYTWSTVGLVNHAWIMGTVQEAWVRNPTTPGTPTPTVCPPGQHLDPVMGVCVPDDPGPGPNPTGSTFTLTTNADGSMLFTPIAGGGPITVTPTTTMADLIAAMAPSGVSITIPPFFLKLLAFICPFAAFIPAPIGPVLVGICALLPHAVKLPDGSLKVALTVDLGKQIAAMKIAPKTLNVPPEVSQVEDWLRGQSATPCVGCG